MKFKYIRSLSKLELLTTGKILYGSINHDKVREYTAREEVMVIEEGVTEIDKYAFLNIKGLKEVYLPSTLEKIREGAFRGCSDLEKVHCSSPIVIVKNGAFKRANKLTTMDICMSIENDDIRYIFGANENLQKPCKLPKVLQSFKLGKTQDGVLQTMTYIRSKDSKVLDATFVPEKPLPDLVGFNEDTREVFELK